MLEYIHKLPTSIQREGVTHVSTGRTIIDNAMLHAAMTYGTVGKNGFKEDPYGGTHKLVIPDMKHFAQSPSSLNTVPDTKGALLEASAQGLANYADEHNLWHTT